MGGGDDGGGGGGSILPPEEEEQKPPKPKDHIFINGCSVEVLTEDNGFEGVFFTATVIEPSPSLLASSKEKLLLVQYHNLLADEGGPERLVEHVNISLVRPEPPSSHQERVEGFEVGEVVDAFHNDGWWIGVVAEVVGGGGGEESCRRFTVSFSHPKDVRNFRASDLRPHWDWVDGAWIKPEKKQVCSTPPIRRSSRVTERCHSRVCPPPRKRRILRTRQQDDQIEYRTITEDLTSDSSPSPPIRRKRRRVGEQEVIETAKRLKDRISWWKRRGRPRKNLDQTSLGKRRGRPPRKNCDQTSLGKRRGRPRKNPFKDHLEASGVQTKENDPEIEEIANTIPNSNLTNNGSLSTFIEDMQSPQKIAAKSLNHGNTEKVRIERYTDRTNGDEVLQEDCWNDLENNRQCNASLPFVKNNILWKTIESMDVFKRIPQSPHFTPLEKVGQWLREGLAIGLMITFTSVSDKVSKLRYSDPQSVIVDILGVLDDLESHGFDVSEIRQRVNDFVTKKQKLRDSLEEVKKLKNELVVRRYEKTRICEDIDGLKRETLLAESANLKADEDIICLESKMQEAKEVAKNAECDFLKLVNTS